MKRKSPDIREIAIENDNGRPISADLRTCSPRAELPLTILCHGFLGYKRWGFFPLLSERLAAAGLHVLTMSFSMNGVDEETGMITRPEEFARNTVSREVEDIHSVCRYVRDGNLPVMIDDPAGWGLFGYSRGAAVALIIASRFTEIKSLVTWATPSRLDRYSSRRKRQWKQQGALVFQDSRSASPLRLNYSYYEDIVANWTDLDLPDRASGLRIPHLAVHCRNDAAVTLGETMELFRGVCRENMRLEIIDGCGHSFGITHPPKEASGELSRAIELSTKWFTQTLHSNERSQLHAW